MALYIPNAGQTGFDSGLKIADMYNNNILQAAHDGAQHANAMVQKTFDTLQKLNVMGMNINPYTGNPQEYSQESRDQIDTLIGKYRRGVQMSRPSKSHNPEEDEAVGTSNVRGRSRLSQQRFQTAEQLLQQQQQQQQEQQQQQQPVPQQQQPVQPPAQPIPQPPPVMQLPFYRNGRAPVMQQQQMPAPVIPLQYQQAQTVPPQQALPGFGAYNASGVYDRNAPNFNQGSYRQPNQR